MRQLEKYYRKWMLPKHPDSKLRHLYLSLPQATSYWTTTSRRAQGALTHSSASINTQGKI